MAVDIQYQISATANFIVSVIANYASKTNGSVAVVSNLFDLWNQSSQDSQKPMWYVCYAGETPWSSDSNISALTHRVSRSWIVRVKQGRGFASNRGDTLSNPVGNAGLFYNVVEHTRDLLRSMLGVSQDAGIDYEGIKPVRLGDQVIDCYDISFSVKADMPNILPQPDDSLTN